jgi:hypothetical protein
MYNHDERVDRIVEITEQLISLYELKGELGEMQNKITDEKISQLEVERKSLEEGTRRNQLHG